MRVSVQAVEHQINHDAGHGDVQPQRQRPSRDLDVPVVLGAQAARGGRDRQGQDDGGQGDMGDENREVDAADDALPGKRAGRSEERRVGKECRL